MAVSKPNKDVGKFSVMKWMFTSDADKDKLFVNLAGMPGLLTAPAVCDDLD
jgi:hypothetical protein